MKKEKFIVKYMVGKELREKTIISTLENCNKDAEKTSKKWEDVYSKKYLDYFNKIIKK